MSERAKIVMLAVLTAALAGVAVWRLGLLGPKKDAGKVSKPKAVAAAAAPAPTPTALRTDLPSREVLDEVAAWVNAPPVEEMPGGVPGRFGIPLAEGAQETPSVVSASDEAPSAVAPTVSGIIAVAGELKAIIGGRTYGRGDAIPGSDCRITGITLKTVTFEDGRGFVVEASLLQ